MEQKVSETEEAPGVTSSMRKNVKRAIFIGIFTILSGIALGTYTAITLKAFELTSFYIILVSTGSGIILSALGAKALQANAECRSTFDSTSR